MRLFENRKKIKAFEQASVELRELMSQNQGRPDTERETRIRDLRLTQTFSRSRKAREVKREDTTLAFDQEMPTCALSELTPDIIRAAFESRGCLYVPSVLSSGEVEALRETVESAQQACRSEQPDPAWYCEPNVNVPEDMMNLYAIRSWAKHSGGCLAVDSPRALYQACEMLERHGLRELAADFLGEKPLHSASKFMLWRVEGNPRPADWHQDGRFLADYVDISSLNVWTALADCGPEAGAPGMELVLDYPDYYLGPGSSAHFDWSVSDSQVDELFRGKVPVVAPNFKAGDMLLFDHWLLHRTYRTGDMSKTRYAIESWFFSPSAFPAGRTAMIA